MEWTPLTNTVIFALITDLPWFHLSHFDGAVISMSISNDLVMGFCKCYAILRKVALPIWDSSRVYAMRFISFLGFDLCVVLGGLVHSRNVPRFLGVSVDLIF